MHILILGYPSKIIYYSINNAPQLNINVPGIETMKHSKIVIVEDNDGITEVLKIILSEEGYEVITTTNGDEFFQIIPEINPDIILLDLKLPGMSGQKIIKLLKKQKKYKNKPIIVISASHHLEKEVMESGASSFISKPFDIDYLIETVNKYS